MIVDRDSMQSVSSYGMGPEYTDTDEEDDGTIDMFLESADLVEPFN